MIDRPVVVELLLARGTLLRQGFRSLNTFFCHVAFSLTLGDHRVRCRPFAFPLCHLTVCNGDRTLRLPELRLSLSHLSREDGGVHACQHIAGLDELSLVHQHGRHAPGCLRRNVDFDSLDATVGARKSRPQVHPIPGKPGHVTGVYPGGNCRAIEEPRPFPVPIPFHRVALSLRRANQEWFHQRRIPATDICLLCTHPLTWVAWDNPCRQLPSPNL